MRNYDQLVKIIYTLQDLNKKPPCKKSIQKIIYLLKESPISQKDFEYNYSMHFYGPYSSELDFELQNLVAENLLSIEYTNFGHLLSTSNKNMDNLENEFHILRSFGTLSPSQLELLATTLYVKRESPNSSNDEIINLVKRIKGEKYSYSEIDNALLTLQKENYFAA